MKFLGKTAKCLGIVVLAAVLALNVWQLLARIVLGQELPSLFGYSHLVVVSGSMEPAISAGDLLIIHREETYREGDVITFRDNGNTVTHRLVGQTAEGLVTKGDANNVSDQESVKPEQIAGRVVFVLPRLGGFILFLRTPVGIAMLALLAAAILYVPGLIGRSRE